MQSEHQRELIPIYHDRHLIKVGREIVYHGDDLLQAAHEFAVAEALLSNKSHRTNGKNLRWIRDGLIYRQVNENRPSAQ